MEENKQEEMETSYQVETNSYTDFNVINSFSMFFDHYSLEEIRQYIINPMYFHRQLMEISEQMYNRTGMLGQTITKMVAAPSLDSVIIPGNSKPATKKKLSQAYDVLNHKINHKLSSRDGLYNALLYGEYIAILRDTKKKNVEEPKQYASGKNIEGVGYIDNVMLQPLDLKYCRFDGYANGDYVVSFDMQYFDLFQGTNLVGEIKNYPREFLVGYNAYKKDGSKRWLRLPQETTFAYKYHAAINESHGRPLAMFALIDMLFSEDYTNSQRNNMYENSSTIRWMELPAGERTGSCSLNKEQQKNQYDSFKSAVRSNDSNQRSRLGGTTTLKLAPGTKIGKLDNSNTFLKDTLSGENDMAVSKGLGFPIAALNGGNSGTNFSTLSISIDLMLSEVFSMLEQFSFQYTKLINNYLGLKNENRLDFVYLNTSTINSEAEFKKQKDLFAIASGSWNMLYSAACGNSDLYLKLIQFEKDMGYDEKFKPHITSYTASNSADKSDPSDGLGGRPKSDAGTLSNSGESTQTNGGNQQPKPSTQ